MHAVLLGASRGCAYYAALYMLQADPENKVTLLLRSPKTIGDDPKFRPSVLGGRCKIVRGDATDEGDVKKLFEGDKVDFVVSGIGGTPRFTLHGIDIPSPVCTLSGMVLSRVLSGLSDPKPRVAIISSMGMGGTHAYMPLPHRILYPWALHNPHQDKEGLEQIFKRASTSHSTPPIIDPLLVPPILDQKTFETLPQDYLPELIIVRPAFLLDGEAEKHPECSSGGGLKVGEKVTVWTVKRGEVGRLIADCASRRGGGGDEWVNKCPIIGR